jgi:glutamyl-tRNA synthetase
MRSGRLASQGVLGDGRYAPSPSGPLHLGNLRTALLAWLFARSRGARFLVRVEDLDPGRSREEHVGGQLADLAALGVDWDGEPVRQSARGDRYAEAVDALRSDGLVYECYCTRAEIREAASAPHGEPAAITSGASDGAGHAGVAATQERSLGGSAVHAEDGGASVPGRDVAEAQAEGAYPGTCRDLSDAERERRRREGRPPALRVRADGARVEVEDALAGPVAGVIDDFVVRRNDGAYAYNLAVVVDDADQRIDEVVRGADLLDSTPRQRWLAARLGLTPPSSYVHVPLMLGDDGARLAKRHGAVTLADRAALGQSAADVRAELAASAGLCDPGERPSAAELLVRFDREAWVRATRPWGADAGRAG